MRVQLQQLRYFVALAETRHFTQAAAASGVTQPSLSRQIAALETALGVALFDRSPGRIELTPAGQALLPRARRILADVDTARREIDQIIGVRRGRLRLGATPSLCTSLIAVLLHRFCARFPGVQVHLDEGGSQDLVAKLGRGQLDQAFIVAPEPGTDAALTGLSVEPILRENLVVASPAAGSGHGGDNGDDDGVRLLRERPLVMYRTGYDLREATLRACRAAGFEPAFAVEGGEMDAVLALVAAGLGVAVVPSLVVAGHPGIRVTALTTAGPAAAPLTRTIAVAHRRDVAPTHSALALRGVLEQYLLEATASATLPPGVTPL